MNFFRNLKKGIWNLVSWFSIVWNDRDWDYCFLYELLKFKLSRMEKYLQKYGHSLDVDKDADSIRKCVVILERLIRDDYAAEDWDWIRRKWGDFEFVDTEDGHTKLTVSGVKTEEENKEYGADVKNCCKNEEDMISKDLNDLFENMKINIRRWWD